MLHVTPNTQTWQNRIEIRCFDIWVVGQNRHFNYLSYPQPERIRFIITTVSHFLLLQTATKMWFYDIEQLWQKRYMRLCGLFFIILFLTLWCWNHSPVTSTSLLFSVIINYYKVIGKHFLYFALNSFITLLALSVGIVSSYMAL